MSTEIDLKALWGKQKTHVMPDMEELLKKAANLKKTTRNKLIGLNLVLLATVVFITFIGFNIDNEKPTTAIGIALIIIAIVSYLMVYDQLMPMLFKTNMHSTSQEYLNELIRIKRKHEFLNKVMINVYFVLLSAGLFLYSLQFVARMTLAWELIYFAVTFGWIAFAWFYLRPRGMRKKQRALNEVIGKLEEVNGQLKGSD